MNTTRNQPVQQTFGTWLAGKLREFDWNHTEAAEKLGVTKMTVGRWVAGRVPEAKYLERISDVFVTDYDYVATLAGLRPRELMLEVDPESPEGQLVPLIRKAEWTPDRLESVKALLRTYEQRDRKRRAAEGEQ